MMSNDNLLRDTLFIAKNHQRCISTSRVLCLVHEDWLRALRQKVVQDFTKTRNIDKDAALLLSPSHEKLPNNWHRVCVKIIHKTHTVCKKLHNGPLYNTASVNSCMEHMAQTSRENYRHIWASAHLQYTTEEQETFHNAQDQMTNVVRTFLLRLDPDVYISIKDHHQHNDPVPNNHNCLPGNYMHHHDNQLSNNIIPTLAVIETMSTFFVVQPFISCSLLDVVSYSPAIFDTSHAKSLFVLYQVLQAMASFHKVGLSIGELTLQNIRIDDMLWVYCTYPSSSLFLRSPGHNNAQLGDGSTSALVIDKNEDARFADDLNLSSVKNSSSKASESGSSEYSLPRRVSQLSECENLLLDAMQVMEEFQVMDFSAECLPKLTEDWVHHRISNFKYLMYVNYLAGRRLGDPNHHPVLPWIIDFTSSQAGLRDLTLSKFRINKGESQLDFTFEAMKELGGDGEHIPHHVSDVLSDITYFVYKARRTPKHMLCAYVRTKWVPNEYPQSIDRMYQWTPDECIPEFFTDASIFTSIHEDLPDLDIPTWCSSAAEFVERHNAMLESEQVSCMLHHWIDLTFGYKLSGTSAVKAKNVYLQLVDQHKTLQNYGVVQLFTHPHPHRLSFDKTLSVLPIRVKRPRQVIPHTASMEIISEISEIKLPLDFDPTAALDHFESLYSFTSRTADCLPPASSCNQEKKLEFSDLHENLRMVWCDMQQFGCLMCELYLTSKLHTQKQQASIRERYNSIGRLCSKDRHNLPRMIQTAADVLLNLSFFKEVKSTPDSNQHCTDLLFEYPLVNSLGLQPPTPALLLQKYANVLPFPPYFHDLYLVLSEMKDIDHMILSETSQLKSSREKHHIAKVLSRKKVEVLEIYLRRNSGRISEEGFQLLLPYIKELFKDPKTTVQAAWSILRHVGKEMGPTELCNNLMPYLIKLFSGEDSTPKHMKLYHRSFLLPLCLSIGLESFLSNFSTLLVEAVAGFKDFQVVKNTTLNDLEEKDDDLYQSKNSNTADYGTSSSNQSRGTDEYDEGFLSNRSGQGSEETDGFDGEIENDGVLQQVNEDDTFEDDDIRPDQREDVQRPCVVDDDDDVDDLDRDFPNISMGIHTQSTDSFSNDQLSGKSNESDLTQDEDCLLTDRGSVDRASIHSISHIISMSKDPCVTSNNDAGSANEMAIDNNAGNCTQSDDIGTEPSDKKMKHSLSVHFSMDEDSSESRPTEQETNQQSKMETSETGSGPSEMASAADEHPSDTEQVAGKSSSFMIRSETDEFQQIYHSHTINICGVAAESIKWLSHRLGPLLTAKHLSKNLVRMLALCYLGEEQIILLHENDGHLPKSTRTVQGDRHAQKLLECLSYVACVYGEQVILLQYIPCIIDLIQVARKRLTVRSEAGLVAAVVLLRHVVPLLADKTFLEMLTESVISEALQPMLRVVSSSSISFPSGSTVRSLVLYKVIDVLYIIGLRLGFELTRRIMTHTLKCFFKPFEQVYATDVTSNVLSNNSSYTDLRDGLPSNGKDGAGSIDESFLNIKLDSLTKQYMVGSPVSVSPNSAENLKKWRTTKSSYSLADILIADDRDEVDDGRSTSEEILQSEFRQAYSPELALAAYIPLTSVFGSHHMEENLPNDDLIRKLCAQYDKALYMENDSMDNGENDPADISENHDEGELGSNVAIVGNQLCLQGEPATMPPDTLKLREHFQHKGILRIDPEETRCDDINQKKLRHLKGDWLAYWEHELGLNERETLFNFKQIKLQTFQGHTNSIRSITSLDNENSFISASKDKTVKLWSLHSFGDGTGRCKYQWSYDKHKKSVFSVAYMENMRLVASCDSTVHVWDPFTGDTTRQLESSTYSPVIALTPLASPSNVVVTATTDSTLRFLDMRSARYAHEYKCVIGSHGLIRCLTASPDGSWVAVGFSNGAISLLNVYTGMLLGSWKAHDSEILQLKAFNRSSFLSTSFDLNMKLWGTDGPGSGELCHFKGHSEPVHCVSFYKNQIVSATTNNKIGVHTSVNSQANFSSTKLRSEVFKGVLTSMEILPLNRTLLLGADNGHIRLLC